MNTTHTLRRVGTAGAIACALYACFLAYTALTVVHRTSYTIDAYCSSSLFHQAQALVSADIRNSSTARGLFKTLQRSIPHLTSVSVKQVKPYTAHIHLHCARPIATINDSWFLTNNAALIPDSWISTQTVLPHTKITTPTILTIGINRDLYAFVSCIPNEIEKNYDITYISPTYVLYVDKDLPSFQILALAKTTLDDYARCALAKIKELIVKRKKQTKFRSYTWTADVRFKGMIVLRGQGGSHENKRIT